MTSASATVQKEAVMGRTEAVVAGARRKATREGHLMKHTCRSNGSRKREKGQRNMEE